MQQASRAAAFADEFVEQAITPRVVQRNRRAGDVLFLQGPVGPFFSRMASDFIKRGFTVHKINFNGGDKLFYRCSNAVDYAGTQEEWATYLREFVLLNDVARIYVFGDCRFYHREAKKVADSLNLDLFVFEEGYLRPNFITLENGGVNGNSPLMNRSAVLGVTSATDDVEIPAGRFGFIMPALLSMIYYMSASFYRQRFPDYIHHRPFGCLSEGAIWIRSGWRKLRNRRAGQLAVKSLAADFENHYFVCPLQVHCDMQVLVHSQFESIDQFICEVMTSFSKHAPHDRALVFKHHPLDRGYTNYKPLIDELAKALHIDQRVYYVHDVCLPVLLRNAEGCVMINSTVGMSSFFHGTPVKVLGDAIYDRKGLTFQGPLDGFWTEPGEVDADAFARFRSFLIRNNQLNGNLYRRCTDDTVAGVVWSGKLLTEHSPAQGIEQPNELEQRVRLVSGKSVNASLSALPSDEIDKLFKSA